MKLTRPDYRITRNTYFIRDLKTRVTKERTPLQIAEQILVGVSIVFICTHLLIFAFY